MSGQKPSFRAQPAVKSIFVYRNGDAHTEARRMLIHEKRVRDFETLLREVTGRVRAPFGAVRCIYTPTAGHRVDALEHVRHGEQYVAAGKEKFKKLDYLQISSRKKQILQNNGLVKAAPQNRISVSARFLKPIKEPCTIFVIANGDVLNPAVRFLIPNRLLTQFEQILEMITEKMGLRILGGVHSLCSLDGVPVTDGKDLENGQFYVAVGRDKFKRLPYTESLFIKPGGVRRNVRSKAASLPPIYKYTKQNREADNDVSKSNDCDEVKIDNLTATLVRQISQVRLMAIRKKRSLSNSSSTQDHDNADPKPNGEEMDGEVKPAEDKTSSAEQVDNSEDKAAGGEKAAAGEELASAQEEEAAPGKEEAVAGKEEAAAGKEEAEAEKEEAAPGKEEATAEKEEAAPGKEEAAAENEEAAPGNEEAAPEKEVAEKEEAAGVKEEAAGVKEEAAAEKEEAVAGKEKAAPEKEEAAPEKEEAAAENEEAAREKEETAAGKKEAAAEEMAAAEKEEAAVKEEAEDEAAGENEKAAVEEEAAAKEEADAEAVAELEAAVENEAAGEDNPGQPKEPAEETGNREGAGKDTAAREGGGEENEEKKLATANR